MLYYCLTLSNLFFQSFLIHVFIIGITLGWFVYQRVSNVEKPIKIVRAIDFKINSLLDFYYSFIVLMLYFSIFVISIIILRLNSLGRSVDMWLIILKIHDFFWSNNYTQIVIYIAFILCICIWVILGLKFVNGLVHFHANRIHILFSEISLNSTLYSKLPKFVLDHYYYISTNVYNNIEEILPSKYKTKIFVNLLSLEENFAFILLLTSLCYDLVFNNLTLFYIFYLLPFILIYKLYRDFLYFYHSRSYFDDMDCAVHCVIYRGSLLEIDSEDITYIKVEQYVHRDFKPEPLKINNKRI